MRIGEVARDLGVSTDTLRFYERAGLLPRTRRGENGYRQYARDDVERLHLILDLRRLDLALDDAARLAGWCHAGHCEQTTGELPTLLAEHRSRIRGRIAGLERLEAQLAALERHLSLAPLPLAGEAGAPCCDAADVLRTVAEGAPSS
jgi:DNA-binding transcriptional MerR regulator